MESTFFQINSHPLEVLTKYNPIHHDIFHLKSSTKRKTKTSKLLRQSQEYIHSLESQEGITNSTAC